MKFWVTYPMVEPGYDPALLRGESVVAFAQAAEAAGFDAIGFTDHPAPSQKWLDAAGHDALDPFTALAYVAAVTERLLLVPNIVVLPYRNPFHVAKAAATLDALSGGRFVLSTATGYLRSEYRALGVDFDRRNELFEEAIQVLKGVWSTDSFSFQGSTFTASQVTARPQPARIPLWFGGNSALTRRRVAQWGDGWNPFRAPAALAQTTKTTSLDTLEDLGAMLAHLWQHVEQAGRDRSEIDVAFRAEAGEVGTSGFDVDRHLESLAGLAGMGVTWNGVPTPTASLSRAIDALHEYGERIIAPSRH
jgi:probable F420-dependent oxidoreductase